MESHRIIIYFIFHEMCFSPENSKQDKVSELWIVLIGVYFSVLVLLQELALQWG